MKIFEKDIQETFGCLLMHSVFLKDGRIRKGKIIDKNDLKISSTLFEFVNNEAIPGTNIKSEEFWSKFSKIVHQLSPINKALIEKRDSIQKKIDEWHKSNKGKEFDKLQSQFRHIAGLIETWKEEGKNL